jgi:mannose-6-phosphate isomerase-like protein (cupin superfamily)
MTPFLDLAAATRFASDKLRKNNVFSTPRMFCDVYCFEPGQSQSAHAHADADKVYVVLQGLARIQIGEDEREAAPGTAALAPAGVPHGVRNPGPGRLSVLVFMAPNPG